MSESLHGEPVVVPAPAPAKADVTKKDTVTYDVDKMELREYLKHVALWNDPVLSGKFLFTLFAIWWYTTGEEGYSIEVFITMVVMLRTLFVFTMHYVGNMLKSKENGLVKKAGEAFIKSEEVFKTFTKLPTQKSIKYWIKGTSDYVETKVAGAFDAMVKAESDPVALQVVFGHLIAFYIILSLFSVKTLFFLITFSALTVTPVYTKQKEQIDPILAKIQEKAQPHVDMLKEKANQVVNIASEKLEAAKIQAAEKLESTKHQIEAKVQSMRKPEETQAKKTN